MICSPLPSNHTRTPAYVPFYLYIDEAHSFITDSIADILAEARKYKLSLFLAHQYIEQLSEPIRAAIFGNVGTLISFRVGANDGGILSQRVLSYVQ
ncbi:MAG: TraM recognition domain-containing protein [Bacteroidota bacterium]